MITLIKNCTDLETRVIPRELCRGVDSALCKKHEMRENPVWHESTQYGRVSDA